MNRPRATWPGWLDPLILIAILAFGLGVQWPSPVAIALLSFAIGLAAAAFLLAWSRR